jgi:hypothetical protein
MPAQALQRRRDMMRRNLISGLLAMVCVLIATLIVPSVALSAVYYVDPAQGRDSNPGTSRAAPWAHIPGDPSGGTRFPMINAGDTIYVKSGAVFNLTGQLAIDRNHYNNGTSSSPITIQRLSTWGSGNVVFNGSGASLGVYASLVWVNKVNYLTLDGVSSQGFDIRNSRSRGFEADGASESSLMIGLTVRNMRVFAAASYSFYLHTQGDFLVENVECNGNSLPNNGGFYTGDNTFGCRQGIYRRCVAHHIGNAPGTQAGGTDANIGFWTTNSYNVAFINCSAHMITGRAFDTGTVGNLPTQMADNILFLNCVATQSFAGFGASLDDIPAAGDGRTQGRQYYVNCLSYANYANGAWVYAGVTAYFYNCLFALNQQVGIYSFSNSDGNNTPTRPTKMYFANTIFYRNNTSGVTGEGSCDLQLGNPSINGNPVVPMYYGDYNLFDQGGGTQGPVTYNYLAPIAPGTITSYFYYSTSAPNFATWQIFSDQDGHSGDSAVKGWHAKFTNPNGYVFTLGNGSSAAGNGTNLSVSPPSWAPEDVFETMKSIWGLSPVDFNNNARPVGSRWDIGPYNAPFSSCTYTVSPTSQSFSSLGGMGRVTVTSQSGCPWTAASGANWVTITSGSSGRGSGTMRYSVSRNTTGTVRTAGATIAGQVFTVNQAARAFTITALAGFGGSVSPSGPVLVTPGESQTFSFKPNPGRRVRAVSVDGRSAGAVRAYTFDNISADHVILVTFR